MSKLIADEALREKITRITQGGWISYADLEAGRVSGNDDNKAEVDKLFDLFTAAQRQLLAELLASLPTAGGRLADEADGYNDCLDQVVSIINHYLTKTEPEQGEKG